MKPPDGLRQIGLLGRNLRERFQRGSDVNLGSHDQGDASLVTQFVGHAGRLNLSEIDKRILTAAKTLIFDAIGVGIAGSTSHESRLALEAAREWGGGQEARVWSTQIELPAALAAFVNGHQMHTLEFDAIHEPSVVHPMTVVFPVSMAYMERESRKGKIFSGNDLLRAVIAGVDIAAGLGEVTTSPLQFFRPATAGAFGAIAAITAASSRTGIQRGDLVGVESAELSFARLIEQGVAAMGLAYSQVSGTMQPHTEGAQVLALQIGFNARAAINAWDLALLGFRGPKKIFDGKYGYFGTIEVAGDPHKLASQLGHQWEVCRTSIKPFPSGRATHAALDAILRLQKEHSISISEIATVRVSVPPMVKGLVGRRPTIDMSIGAARLCLSYLIPNALMDGTISLASYNEDRLRNPLIYEFANQVTIEADQNIDPNAFDPQTISITLKSGAEHSITLPASLGSPASPMSESQLFAKFESNLQVGGKSLHVQKIHRLVTSLEEVQNISELVDLL